KLARASANAPADVVIAPDRVDEVRDAVADALRRRVAVSFRYQAPDAPAMTRTVDPVQVLITDGQGYLQGWCHLREAMRTFHLDRVSEPQLTDIPITHADELLHEAFTSIGEDDEVTVRLPERLIPLLGDYVRPDNADIDDGVVTVRISISDPRSIKRVAARFGGHLVVHEPQVARAATRDWAADGLALYAHPEHFIDG